jgi:hypothetical protein
MVKEIARQWHFGTSTGVVHLACIVAVTSTDESGDLDTWAAYGGGYPLELSRQAGAELVAKHGDKLSKTRACAIFPSLPADLYRE